MKIIIFPGQGSQKLGMGSNIYHHEVVKKLYAEVNDAIGYDITKIMFGDDKDALLENAQIAIMAASMALIKLIEHKTGKSISAKFMAGHSLGQYTALCASGSLSVYSAAKLLKARSLAMQTACLQTKGAMAACIGISATDLKEVLSTTNEVQIANYNSSSQIVISGESEATKEIVAKLKQIGKKAILLEVAGAFHSKYMNKAEEIFEDALADVSFKEPITTILDNVTAEPLDFQQIKKQLSKQITSSVLWYESMEFALQNGCTEVIEIGPQAVLTKMLKRDLGSATNVELKNITSEEDI